MSQLILSYLAIGAVTFALLVDEIMLSAIFHVLLGAGSTVTSSASARARRRRCSDVADLSSGNKRGMTGGAALKRLVNGFLENKPIEKMPRRFAAGADIDWNDVDDVS